MKRNLQSAFFLLILAIVSTVFYLSRFNTQIFQNSDADTKVFTNRLQATFHLPDLDKEYFDEVKYSELLAKDNFEELSRLCAIAELKQRTDLRYDAALINVLSFDQGSLLYKEVIAKANAWRVKKPDSSCPVIAQALANMFLGIAMGEEDREKKHLKAAYQLANQLRKETNSILAYYLLINLAPHFPISKPDLYNLIGQAEQVCPQCYKYRRAAVRALSPLWYGSDQEMELFVSRSLQYLDENPQLLDLKAFSRVLTFNRCIFPGPAYSPAIPKEKVKACLPYLNQAIEISPATAYRETRIEALLRLEDNSVMKDLDFLMQHNPESEKPYYSMAMAQFRFMKWEESSKYLELSLRYTRTKNKIREEYLKKMLDFYEVELQTRCDGNRKNRLCSQYYNAKEILDRVYGAYLQLPDISRVETSVNEVSEEKI